MKAQIVEDMKTAMKAKEKDKLGVIRLVLAAIKQKEVDTREELDEKDVMAVLRSMLKQRQESIKQYDEAGREDLSSQERFEVGIIEAYLPAMMDSDAVANAIDGVIKEVSPEGMKDMGKVMGAAKAKLDGKADMGLVSRLVKEKLQAL